MLGALVGLLCLLVIGRGTFYGSAAQRIADKTLQSSEVQSAATGDIRTLQVLQLTATTVSATLTVEAFSERLISDHPVLIGATPTAKQPLPTLTSGSINQTIFFDVGPNQNCVGSAEIALNLGDQFSLVKTESSVSLTHIQRSAEVDTRTTTHEGAEACLKLRIIANGNRVQFLVQDSVLMEAETLNGPSRVTIDSFGGLSVMQVIRH